MKLTVNNKRISLQSFSAHMPTKRKSYANKYAIVVEFFANKTLTGYEKEKVSIVIAKALEGAEQ